MARAQDIDEVSPGILVWQAYDHRVKAELFSTALETRAGLCIVDPILLGPDSLQRLQAHRRIAAICVTNANHVRAVAEFARTFSVPVYVHNALCGNVDLPNPTGVRDGMVVAEGLVAVAIDGGPAGEMALYHDDKEGTMVLGDALINFEPNGLALLPAKYCLDARLMRQSLRKLLDYRFDHMLFAHGSPILSGARARVERLLGTD